MADRSSAFARLADCTVRRLFKDNRCGTSRGEWCQDSPYHSQCRVSGDVPGNTVRQNRIGPVMVYTQWLGILWVCELAQGRNHFQRLPDHSESDVRQGNLDSRGWLWSGWGPAQSTGRVRRHLKRDRRRSLESGNGSALAGAVYRKRLAEQACL